MESTTVQWCDLPKELLYMIAQRLNSRIDVLRFRSVCMSWRHSFLSPPSAHTSSLSSLKIPFPFPFPFPFFYQNLHGHFTLSESAIYHFSSVSTSSSSKGWLVRVKEEEPNKIRMESPLANYHFLHLPPAFPKVLKLSDFRITELCKVHCPQRVSKSGKVHCPQRHFLSNNPMNILNRRLVAPNIIDKVAISSSYNYAIMAIYNKGKLGFYKSGDDEVWITIDERNYDYSDVINYMGKFYAVNYSGRVIMIDDSVLKFTEIVSSISGGGGHQKHLVESFGDLLLVDIYLHQFSHTAVQFKVYKLNEQEGKWVKVESLGDRVLFLGKDCSFSAFAQDFVGCKGNCVYYFDQCSTIKEFRANNDGVFDLEDDILHPLAFCHGYSDKFWPPATRVKPKPLPYVC